ncbi:hypothetical protein HBO34_15385 [Pseudomonas veronii]|nr:hypothetical protein [Pseudomonas veronii]
MVAAPYRKGQVLHSVFAAAHYTWHQVDDFDAKSGNTTMQLVRKSAYEATYPHGGSVAQYEKHFKIKGRTCLNKSATLHS